MEKGSDGLLVFTIFNAKSFSSAGTVEGGAPSYLDRPGRFELEKFHTVPLVLGFETTDVYGVDLGQTLFQLLSHSMEFQKAEEF